MCEHIIKSNCKGCREINLISTLFALHKFDPHINKNEIDYDDEEDDYLDDDELIE
jgi:hypothetical protein